MFCYDLLTTLQEVQALYGDVMVDRCLMEIELFKKKKNYHYLTNVLLDW